MNELVNKIIEWQDFDEYVKTIKQFKNPTEEELEKEKKSGWYYIKPRNIRNNNPINK